MHSPPHPKSKLFFIFQLISIPVELLGTGVLPAPVPIQPGVEIPPFPAFLGKRLPELGLTKKPPPALSLVRDGHSIPRNALLPGFYSPSRVSGCVC